MADIDGTPLGAPYIVNGNANVVLDDSLSPYTSQGASIGNIPHAMALPPDMGGLTVESGVTWHNEGLFWVGSHFGNQSSVGSVTFAGGSTFYNVSPGFGSGLPEDVRIGQGGSGGANVVAVFDGATWYNQGQPGQVNFTIGEFGTLSVEGALYSDSSTAIMDGTAIVQGANAVWQVGGFGLDLEGIGNGGLLQILLGGHMYEVPSLNIGFSDGNRGRVEVGDEFTPEVRSLLEASFIELGVFGSAHGELFVTGNGRVETQRILLGRSGGTGLLKVNTDGEVLVGGHAAGPFGNLVELRPDSTIDVSEGGKVVIGSNTAPLLEPVFGAVDMFGEIEPGTVLVGQGGRIKGTGTVIGTLRIADGSLIVGHSTGTFTVEGDLVFEGDGTLEIEIAGPDDYDRVVVNGALTLGGMLQLSFIDGFAPSAGDFFALDLFQAGSTAGSFAGITATGLAPGLTLALDLDALDSGGPLSFSVVPVPLPAAAWLLATGLGGLALRGRRRG